MIKFLDLNTGYSFDGLWSDVASFSDWTIVNYETPKKCNICGYTIDHNIDISSLLNDKHIEVKFSDSAVSFDSNPSIDKHLWNDDFTINTKCIAYRTHIPQTKGYIFWFPNEQSVNITYTMPVCILSENVLNDVNITVEDNDVFSLISHTGATTTVDGFVFDTPEYSNSIQLNDYELVGKYNAYVFNVACHSENEGEYICNIKIGDLGYIKVGADMYGAYEPVNINLSNFGVELPDTIQKAIYDSNVHEDLKDNILINKKFKELLSNYWDIVANKGSYKSLENSVKWFEWGDNLTIKEIWRHENCNRSFFADKDIITIFEDTLNESIENYIKTTYVSLYCSMYDELPEYDSEFNPVLAKTVMKWCREDMQLKLSLLAQFFGTFFLPIHVSILHATLEDKVFTNTIKSIVGSVLKRDDCVGDFTYVNCNIKDDSTFKMTNVRAQATNSTLYAVRHIDDDNLFFGVDDFASKGYVDENNISMFAQQYYAGPGVILPIEMTIENQRNKDFINHTIVDLIYSNHNERMHFYDIITAKKRCFDIRFNFLAKEAANYTIRFTFLTGSGKTITRTIKFTVEDADNLNINVYKVQAKDDTAGFTYKDFADKSSSHYFFKIQNEKPNTYYIQHLPYMLPDNPLYKSYKGIKLTRTVVFDVLNKNGKGHVYNDYELLVIRGLMDNDFLEFDRYELIKDTDGNVILDENTHMPIKGDLAYMIFVSKHFYADVPHDIIKNEFNIIRNDLGFYPQFHKLTLMQGDNIDNYTVSQYDAICCAAEINNFNKIEQFRYGHLINNAEWTFVNASDNSIVYHPTTSRVPFIATKNNTINPGYYDISFKYSLTNGITDECKINSGFRIKVI